MSNEVFAAWLNTFDMKQAEIARRSGISTGQISRLFSGLQGVGIDTAVDLARALGVSPYTVFEKAANLSNAYPIEDAQKEELLYLFDQLPEAEKDWVMSYLRLKVRGVQ